MEWIVNYIRRCFCTHDLVFESKYCESTSEFGIRKGERISVTCKKCGHHRSYWKF